MILHKVYKQRYFGNNQGVSDLNSDMPIGQCSGFGLAADPGERRQNAVCASDGLLVLENLSSHCDTLRWRPSRSHADLRRAVPLYGVRAVYLPRESARHRSLPLSTGRDRKSTRLNSSHLVISYAVFCLKKKTSSRVVIISLRLPSTTHLYRPLSCCMRLTAITR